MPQFLHLPPLAAAIVTITGVVLAVVRLLTASKAFWWRFPEWLQKGLPAALVALGTLPTALEAAKSWLDVVVAFVFAVGAWFTASRGDKRPVEAKPPAVPPIGMLLLTVLVFCLSVSAGLACSGAHAVSWPKVLSCAEPLEQPLVESVAKVLAGTGDVQSELEALTAQYAPGVVECAVAQLVSDIGKQPADAKHARIRARGQAFLATVPR